MLKYTVLPGFIIEKPSAGWNEWNRADELADKQEIRIKQICVNKSHLLIRYQEYIFSVFGLSVRQCEQIFVGGGGQRASRLFSIIYLFCLI